MSENDNDLQQQLAEVNHKIDNLSPNMEPGDYLRRSSELEKQKKVLEQRINGKDKTGVQVTYKQDVDVDPFFKDYDVSVELKTKDPHKKKKAFKMLSAFSILFIIIAVLVLVSWILHWSGVTYNKDGDLIQPMGVVDIFYSAFKGFESKIDIIIFVLIIGAFITVVMSSKALDGFAQGVIRKLKGKEVFALIPLMFFFSICGAVEGFAEESLGFYLFLIPIMLMCGFDVFTAVIAILVGAGVGVLTSVVNPFIVTMAVDNMNQGLATKANQDPQTFKGLVSMGDGLVWRLVTWFLFTCVAVGIVMAYAIHVKNNPSKSITFSTYEGDKTYFLGTNQEDIKMNWKRTVTLLMFVFGFLLMIVYLIDWDAIIGTDVFEKAGAAVKDKAPYITHAIPGFGKGELIVPATFFLIISIFLGIINGVGENGFLKLFIDGAADMLSVCMVIAVAGGVTWILQQSHMEDLFVGGLGHLTSITPIARVIVLYLIFLPLAFLIPSASGFATAVFPLLSGLILKDPNGAVVKANIEPIVTTGSIQAFSFATGLINLFAPTSGVVMGAIGIARMDYKTFMKGIAPILGIFFVLSIGFLAIGGALAPLASIL